MNKTFKKLKILNRIESISILIIMLLTLTNGIISKINGAYNEFASIDFSQYMSELEIINKISDYVGVGLRVVILVYIILLLIYLIIEWLIPLIISSLIIFINKKKINIKIISRIIISILIIGSYIPGIIISTNIIELIEIMITSEIFILHIITLVALNITLFLIRVIILIKFILTKNNKGDINNGFNEQPK